MVYTDNGKHQAPADNDNEELLTAANDNEEGAVPFPPIEETEEPNCREIFLSVIIQHILDAKGKSGTKKDQAEAIKWFEAREGLRSGLADVCTLANLDFEETRKRCLELIKDERGSVDFRCLKKPATQNRSKGEKRTCYYRRVDRNERIRRAKQKHSHSSQHQFNGNVKFAVNDNSTNQHEEKANDKQAN